MRSKSLDGNSYDSGDWFNAIRWDCTKGNGFGIGLPIASDNQSMWAFARPLLADASLVPSCTTSGTSAALFRQFLTIKRSSPLLSLTSEAQVRQRLTFPLSGTAGQVPGVITEHLDGTGMRTPSLTIVVNATGATVSQTVPSLAGTRQRLHPAQGGGTDPVVKQARFAPATGTFTVPARTVVVFVEQ